MDRGVRLVILVAVIGAFGSALLLTQAGAGPTEVDPGLKQAQEVLDCAPGEGVFSYQAEYMDGAGFETPGAALAALLAATDFGVPTSDFVSQEVAVDGSVAKEFTAKSGEKDTLITWATPVDKGWLADSAYGCTALAD